MEVDRQSMQKLLQNESWNAKMDALEKSWWTMIGEAQAEYRRGLEVMNGDLPESELRADYFHL